MDIKRLLRKETPAPLWKRIVAYLLDALILSFILLPLGSFDTSATSFAAFYTHLFSGSSFTFPFFLTFLLMLCISLAYWTILEYRYHQTLGKHVLHLLVRSEGKTLTFSHCFLRNVAKLSSILLFFDVLYMFFSRGPQRYSETLARTEVISHG